MARQTARGEGHGSGPTTRGSHDDVPGLHWGPRPGQHDEVNPWAWADVQHDDETDIDTSQCRVTAVLVTFDAEEWLADTLAGLASLTRRPERLIAIDNDSVDGTRDLLDKAVAAGLLDAVYSGARNAGFGAAVTTALQQDRRSHRATAPGGVEHSWLWLLHDDAVPAPDTLSRLLQHVVEDSEIDITGPKLLLPGRRHHTRQLSEVGVSISGTGRRELMLDPGEIDQGQRDLPERRLGVSSCGMLVRESVWSELGGFDPAVPVFRDGVEFGWRAQLCGHRVVTTPHAAMVHRQVGRAGLRSPSLIGRRPAKTDRELGMLVVAGHAPRWQLPAVWLRLAWSCVLHAIGYLLGKVPGRSLDEILALSSFVRHPGRIRALRRRLATLKPDPAARDVVKRLRPPWWWSLRLATEAVTGVVSERYRSVAGDGDGTSLDELTGDDFSAMTEESAKNPWLSPVVVTAVLATVASLVAARELFGPGSLTASALLPAPEHLGQLWHSVVEPIYGAAHQSAPPWLTMTAVGATLTAGSPELFVTLLLCGVVPFAFLSVYPLTRRVIHDRRIRLWVAATYALLPVLLGGTNQGRLSLSVFAIGLPLLALAVRSLALRRPHTPEAWRGGWGAGVVLVLLVAFEPSILLLALLGGALGAVLLRRSPEKVGRIGIALAVPLLVLAPWWPGVVAEWGRLFAGPDAALGGAGPAPSVAALMLGRPGGPGLPPSWLCLTVFGMLWLVALVGLARRPRSRTVVAAWVTALLGLTASVALSRLVVTVPPAGDEIRPWVGSYLLLTFAALILAAGVGVDGLSAELARRSFSLLQPAAVVVGAVVPVVTVAASGWWVWAGASGPVDRLRLDALPPYVVNAIASDARVRVLGIDLSQPTARFFVVDDDNVRLGDADRGFTYAGSQQARQQVADLVVRLTAGTADATIGEELRQLGIGYVWVRGADDEEVAQIDNTPGLGAASGTLEATVWQLKGGDVSRAVVAAGSALSPVGAAASLPDGPPGRRLLIGEAADRQWRATVGGQRLTAAPVGWQQAFDLPPTGGRLEYGYPSTLIGQLVACGALLLVAIVLAAPAVRRPEVRDPARSARRAAHVGEADL